MTHSAPKTELHTAVDAIFLKQILAALLIMTISTGGIVFALL
jgi:hypothetical protein